MSLTVRVEFSGGLELLFSNQRTHTVVLHSLVSASNDTKSTSDGELKAVDMEYLIYYLRDHLLQDRPELFMENGTVRPGILVLINDTDWELEGEGSYALKDKDEIVILSTLHGG